MFITLYFNSLLQLYSFILFLAVRGLRCCVGFSLPEATGGYSLVVVHGLLITLVSLVAEHGLSGVWALVAVAHGLTSCGSWALEYRLNSCGVQSKLLHSSWDFPEQGSNLCLLHWWVDSLPLSHPGSLVTALFIYLSFN